MGEKKPLLNGRTFSDFLIGIGVGAGLDILIPTHDDGSLSNTLRQGLYPLIPFQFAVDFNSKTERIIESTAFYVGTLVGQTGYHMLKTYL